MENKVEKRTCYISVYEVHRAYGGPEEGGWYYDYYEHTGVSVPFNGIIEWSVRELDYDDDYPEATSTDHSQWEHNGKWFCLYPDEIKVDADETKKEDAWVEMIQDQLRDRYPNAQVVIEWYPGRRADYRTPRYS